MIIYLQTLEVNTKAANLYQGMNSWGGWGGGLYFIVEKLCRTNIPLFSFQIFTGNNDSNTIKYNEISRPAATRSVIFIPFQWNTNVGLRLELYGCLQGRCFERIVSGFSNARYQVGGYSWSGLLLLCFLIFSLFTEQNYMEL